MLATWLDRQLVFILAAIASWTAFLAVRTHRDPTALREWGFTRRGFGRSMRMLLPFTGVALLVTAGYGLLAGKPLFTWRFFLLLALYPAWGLVQQFLVAGLFAGAIRKYGRLPAWAIIAGTSLLFAAIHLPSIPLVVLAGLMGAIATSVYFQAGNLFALGLFHGWTATFTYFFVLGTDPLTALLEGGLWP